MRQGACAEHGLGRTAASLAVGAGVRPQLERHPDDLLARVECELRGRGAVAGGRVTIDASASSQFVSALLLAGARYDEGVDVLHDGKPVPSLPHIDMTVAALREHGVRQWQADVVAPLLAKAFTSHPDPA